MDTPMTHQGLLEMAIDNRRYVIAETSGQIYRRGLELRKWAQQYAKTNGLVAPKNLEAYGIYYLSDEEKTEFEAEGLWP